jgi:4-amino-4-deoxy-L-arabinose transferase-like glycosyltransferase
LGFVPSSPFEFVSRMSVMTEPFGPADPAKPAEYRIYAKYPPGYPLMAAFARKAWGWAGMYMVNPICTVLACFMAYFLFRQVVSPFMSLLGVLWLACNPLVIFYANDANSHSSALLCSVVGFWGLLSWMKTKETWRAWVGGFALGYACTIRYSEFLLVLPVLFAAAVNFRWNWKRAMGSVSVILAWAIPVAALALVCWISFGAPWKTGYAYCKESTGFGWKYLTGDLGDPAMHKIGNWETFVQQLNHTALFLLWGPALVGLFALMGSWWRLGVTLALWVLPQTILYMLYYWAPGGETSISYMRFFMTLMPGLILAGLWAMERGLAKLPGEKWASLVMITMLAAAVLVAGALYLNQEPIKGGWALVGNVAAAVGHMVMTWKGLAGTLVIVGLTAAIWLWEREMAAGKVAMAMGAGVITAFGCGVNLYNISMPVESLYTQSVGLRDTIDNTRALLPAGSVLFSDDSILNQMDCVGGWKLVNTKLFTQLMFHDSLRRYENVDKDKDDEEDPDPIQRERSQFYMELLGRKNSAGQWIAKPTEELLKYENDLIDGFFAQGKRVAFLVMERESRGKTRVKIDVPQRRDCEIKELGRWVTQPPVGGSVLVPGKLGRFGGPAVAPLAARPGKLSGCFVLYELVKKAPTETKAEDTSSTAAPARAARTKERRGIPAITLPANDHAGELFPNVPGKN